MVTQKSMNICDGMVFKMDYSRVNQGRIYEIRMDRRRMGRSFEDFRDVLIPLVIDHVQSCLQMFEQNPMFKVVKSKVKSKVNWEEVTKQCVSNVKVKGTLVFRMNERVVDGNNVAEIYLDNKKVGTYIATLSPSGISQDEVIEKLDDILEEAMKVLTQLVKEQNDQDD